MVGVPRCDRDLRFYGIHLINTTCPSIENIIDGLSSTVINSDRGWLPHLDVNQWIALSRKSKWGIWEKERASSFEVTWIPSGWSSIRFIHGLTRVELVRDGLSEYAVHVSPVYTVLIEGDSSFTKKLIEMLAVLLKLYLIDHCRVETGSR